MTVTQGLVHSRDVSIGQFWESVGSLSLSGSGAEWSTSFDGEWHGVSIGEEGDAVLSVQDNAFFNHGHGASAFNADSDAVVEVTGTDSEWYVDGAFDMSVWGHTVVDIRNGGLVNIGKLTMAAERGSSAQITITGENHESELQLHAHLENSLTIGRSGRAGIQVYGSKLWNQGTMTLGENPGSSGLLEIHEGSWVDCFGAAAVGGSLDNAGGTGRIDLIDDTPGDQQGVDFTPTSDAGQFVKVWPQGTIAMDGGVIEMEYGELQANPIILQGGTLSGHGMIWAHVDNRGGIVNPADDQDQKKLEIGYDYTQDAMGTLKIALGGHDIESRYATLQVDHDGYGRVSLDGMLDVELVDGFVPDYADEFIIITARTVSGTFSNAVLRYVFEGGSFDVIYNADSVILTHFDAESLCLRYSPADMNRDCLVNLADFAVFAAEWLDCSILPESDCPGQTNAE
jgi:T5SS/PEP-CTERM-associated repeat protein